MRNIDSKLAYPTQSQQQVLKELSSEYGQLFSDVPWRTDTIIHDVDVGDAQPIKQHPYRLNPQKEEYLKNEVLYLLDNDFIEPRKSNWSSPCLLVPKPDQSYRMCTDYRKHNSVTKTDTFAIPRIDDCIDKVGKAKYVTKIDLRKGQLDLKRPVAESVEATSDRLSNERLRALPLTLKFKQEFFVTFYFVPDREKCTNLIDIVTICFLSLINCYSFIYTTEFHLFLCVYLFI